MSTAVSIPGLGAVVAAAYFGLGAGAASAAADLVIVEEDSTIVFESCERDQPLATGVIAIKNIGDSRARLRLGVLTRYTRSLLAVYSPEHLDIIDNAYERSALDSQDQESIKVSLGANRVKRGRLGGTADLTDLQDAGASGVSAVALSYEDGFTDNALLDLTALSSDETKDLQRALQQLGHYRGRIDGVIGSGGRRAIEAFQRSIGDRATGQLTLGQTEALSAESGRSLVLVTSEALPVSNPAPVRPQQPQRPVSAGGATQVTLYAVVDPYNLVPESDESNNLVKFTGVINCR